MPGMLPVATTEEGKKAADLFMNLRLSIVVAVGAMGVGILFLKNYGLGVAMVVSWICSAFGIRWMLRYKIARKINAFFEKQSGGDNV